MINDDGEAALCDFGLAHFIEQLNTSRIQGEKGYIAPELLDNDGGGKTKESDVFAFGGLILHTMSGFAPFHHKSVPQALTEVYLGRFPSQDKHPAIHPKATLWNLMQKCWARDPVNRPGIREIYESLTEEEIFYTKTGSLRKNYQPEPSWESPEIRGSIVPRELYRPGGFADVYVGEWTPPGRPVVLVAIKSLRCVYMESSQTLKEQTDRVNKRLKREVGAWEKLSHDNITPLLGYRSGKIPLLITPFYKNGNLHGYLAANPNASKLKLIIGAANGLLYLHTLSPPVIHGDIKPDNVLVNDAGEAALCDFGLARILEQLTTGFTTSGQHGKGGMGYVATELWNDEGGVGKTKASDVFAF
ncbi:hypothetical protein FRB94_006713, partial [Tulasnella sp. JGI-2019a]